jgi:hypothetical protein
MTVSALASTSFSTGASNDGWHHCHCVADGVCRHDGLGDVDVVPAHGKHRARSALCQAAARSEPEALEEIAGKLDAVAGTCSGQPAQLLESAAHLRGAVDEMRWQYNNRELLLNDQLELLAQQARALARLRYEAISLPGDFAGDGAGHAAATRPGRQWREDSAQPVAQASGLSVHSRGRHADAKVVTLKEHLRQF